MYFLSRPSLIAMALACICGTGQAQTIDQFDVRREGNDAVLQLRFSTEIAFQRSVSTRSGDLTLIFYSLVTSTNAQVRASQGLSLGAAQGLPALRIADESERGERDRKIVLRTVDATRLEVRAGQGNRSIEIVLRGVGPRVSSAPAGPVRRAATPGATAMADVTPATLPQAERRFVIVLQSSAEPNVPLSVPVPRSLQDYDVFTSERMVDGNRRYEVSIGHFASRTQADAVLRQLTAFPHAAIVATGATEATPAAAAAAAPALAVAVPVTPALPTVVTPALPATAPPDAPPATPAAAAAGRAPEAPPATPTEIDARSDALLTAAQGAMAQQNPAAAIAPLNELLNLPPNRNTQAAQELAGVARARAGDLARARIEFETYLQLYPQGDGSERVRRELAALPAATPRADVQAAAVAPRPAAETTVTGSASMTYFGGNGQVRSQDFKDSILAGVPQVAGDPQFSPDKAQQLLNDVDLTWRRRDADSDLRFVFRDQYTSDLERSDKSKNRLSALYVDYKSLSGGYGVRLGRQSPTGGGVMGRFDGVTANVVVRPKLKLSAVAGQPTDKYFESKRRFYGASVDADGLLPNFGATAYLIQQTIDDEIDRRGLGLEFRYFKGGASVFSQFDYDLLIKGLNIATVQGTLIMEDNTVFNALYDRRALSMFSLGNSLAFEDAATPGVRYTRIADKLAVPGTTLEVLRDQIKRITPFVTQAQLGLTKPINKTWQVGASAQLTNTGEIPIVPGVLGFDQKVTPASGNIYSVSAQLIGLNLYSQRDTHVFSTTGIQSPNLKGFLLSYNNSSIAWNVWQFEPSLQYYRDRSPQGNTSERWTPGLRVTYRGWERWSLESSLTYELGKATRIAVDPNDPTLTTTTKESSSRANYALGARYSF